MCLIHFQTFFVRTARPVWPHLGDTYFLKDKLLEILEIPDQYPMDLLNSNKKNRFIANSMQTFAPWQL